MVVFFNQHTYKNGNFTYEGKIFISFKEYSPYQLFNYKVYMNNFRQFLLMKNDRQIFYSNFNFCEQYMFQYLVF